ncbi:YceI family protein [Pseudovibrio exalbescens]|uniref:YceI family protein n=1 Tax=Pseudovibrio exalbescens TaxID=197461 RepID=UPI000C99D090|nr:YceI family protein [Pseudovibrio exalbescens]
MSSFNSLRAAGLFAVCLIVSTPALAMEWTVNSEKSSLSFETTQNGQPLTGTFGTWDAAISLDPNTPETGSIEATISTGSADTGNGQINGTLTSDAWFNSSAYPDAVFSSDEIAATTGNRYEARGTLTIRGISVPLTLPFTLSVEGDEAHATAQVALMRSSFEMGQDISADTVPDKVAVTLDLWATR